MEERSTFKSSPVLELRIIPDVQISRRKRVHTIVNPENTVLHWTYDLGEALDWLAEKGHSLVTFEGKTCSWELILTNRQVERYPQNG